MDDMMSITDIASYMWKEEKEDEEEGEETEWRRGEKILEGCQLFVSEFKQD